MNSHLSLIEKLYEIGAIQFGSFQLKSGIQSPFYLDLRLIISYPSLLKTIADMIWTKAHLMQAQRICGVPYTALPLATCLSVDHNMPMIMKRKEAKHHGTKKMIEGVFHAGENCLVIEDVITSGQSIIETIECLQESGLTVSDIIVVIDREQGGKIALEKQGYHVHPLLTIRDVIQHLRHINKLPEGTVKETEHFILTHQISF